MEGLGKCLIPFPFGVKGGLSRPEAEGKTLADPASQDWVYHKIQ